MIGKPLALAASVASLLFFGIPAGAEKPFLRSPLDIPLTLSGNFGELRRNHFHSGVDFKTQGRTGLPVHAVDDGYVARASVSPWGFGRAVYVVHPSTGLTTVYGHLEAFNPEIDKRVRDEQYRRETFTIDLEFGPDEIPVKRGDVIARSGNAGSSGGPHLHFDVRDTASEDPLDPLAYYRDRVADKVAPSARLLALYPAGGEVEGSAVFPSRVTLDPKSPAPTFHASGRVIPGIKAYDRMSGTSNIYGIKHLSLKIDGKEVYRRTIDRFGFDYTRGVHTLVDYPDLVNSNSWVMTTHIPPSRPLGDMEWSSLPDGILDIEPGKTYRGEWVMEDEHGNRAIQPFTIVGVKGEVVHGEDPKGALLEWNEHHVVSSPDEDIVVDIPNGALYDDIRFDFEVADDSRFVTPLYSVGDPGVPLAKGVELRIKLPSDTLLHKRHYCLVSVNPAGKMSAVGSNYSRGSIVGKVTSWGNYAVTTDRRPPVITPQRPAGWRKAGKISLKITDNLSGVQTFAGTLDGKFALFELDGKTATLSYDFADGRHDRNRPHDVRVVVTDACGNTSVYEGKY
ncbi:MAG: M23 family metallopeptidase [Muribaculaceae bacterium]|nr:M23 family metallopeptidase [Muribaculaceae bacterium]